MPKIIKNDIHPRQICFIFLALMPVNKILTLPSILARFTENQLYLPLIISLSLDILTLFFILKIGERYKGKTFFKILSTT